MKYWMNICGTIGVIDKKPIFFKSWNESGIKRISDVMKFNGLICSKEDLANEFGIHIDIMKCYPF